MSDLCWREPAKGNVINMNGMVPSEGFIRFCVGFGTALGQKVKLVNMGTARYTRAEVEVLERTHEWYGI